MSNIYGISDQWGRRDNDEKFNDWSRKKMRRESKESKPAPGEQHETKPMPNVKIIPHDEVIVNKAKLLDELYEIQKLYGRKRK